MLSSLEPTGAEVGQRPRRSIEARTEEGEGVDASGEALSDRASEYTHIPMPRQIASLEAADDRTKDTSGDG